MTTIELLERFDQDDDFDSDLGKSQHKYLLAVLDQMKVRDKDKKLSRKERAEQAERKRIQGVRRMLSRAASQRCGTSDEQDLYKLLSKYDGAINAVIDGLGNTAAHWVTNLNKKVKKTMSDDQEFWSFEDATPFEREARESWLDVVIGQCKPDVTIKNIYGLSPLDYACQIGPSMVTFLCQNSTLSNSERRKAIARAYITAANGEAEETCEASELYQAIIDLGYDINQPADMLVAGFTMITQDTFKNVLKQCVAYPNPKMSTECFEVLKSITSPKT